MKLNPTQKFVIAAMIADELADEEDEEEEEETEEEDQQNECNGYDEIQVFYDYSDDYEEEEEPGIRKGRSYAEDREQLWDDLGFSEKTKKRMNFADDLFGCVEALLNVFIK